MEAYCMILKKLLSVFILAASVAYAGTTGKIAGRVVDGESGEPLPGVNVVVLGTMLGAATGGPPKPCGYSSKTILRVCRNSCICIR